MKRRILLVDDDLAVLLTLKAVLELHGFEVETAGSSAEAFARMDSGVYQMVISDLRMETEDAGLEVIRTAQRQLYDPATALLTAYAPISDRERGPSDKPVDAEHTPATTGAEAASAVSPDSLLIKPLGTLDLLRQLEALLISHADKQARRRVSAFKAQEDRHRAG
jgi:CheY-like chemotaxis protein